MESCVKAYMSVMVMSFVVRTRLYWKGFNAIFGNVAVGVCAHSTTSISEVND